MFGYDATGRIVYVIAVGMGVVMLFGLYIPGLNEISVNIDEYSQEEYKAVSIMENAITLEDDWELDYDYDRRRAMMPVEYFTQTADDGDDLGYRERNDHCYLPAVKGLDGENYGFYIVPLEESETNAENPVELDCTEEKLEYRDQAVFSPVLLVREGNDNPLLPARLYVYEI